MALFGILLAALWFAGLLLCLRLLMNYKPKKSTRYRRPRREFTQHVPLENQLVSLLNGDNRTAQRLIKATRRKHPNRSEQWCQEKALYDLERDRR